MGTEARSLLRRADWLVRARRGLALAGGCGQGLLAAGTGLRPFGVALPPWAWIFAAAGLLVGVTLPRPKDKTLLWAGRRLGVGARLVALTPLHARGEEALAGRLQRELGKLRPRWWGIFLGRREATGALALAAMLALFFLLPPFVWQRPTPPAAPAEEVAAQSGTEPESQEPEPPRPTEPARLALPQAAPSGLPFQDLLAEVYGLSEGVGPWRRERGWRAGSRPSGSYCRRWPKSWPALPPRGSPSRSSKPWSP